MNGKFNIKQFIQDVLTEQEISELSPATFLSAVNVSKDRGTDNRTRKLGTLYFNKFIGLPLLGGKIKEITTQAPQQGNYRQVSIVVEREFPNAPVVPDSLKYDYVHYDIDSDLYNVTDSIDRKDAFVLSKIALHINPNSKYKETGKYFNIKGF